MFSFRNFIADDTACYRLYSSKRKVNIFIDCWLLFEKKKTKQISEFGACPRKPCNNGYYPIHEAAKNASSKTMEVFFQVCSTVNAINSKLHYISKMFRINIFIETH